MSSSFSNGAQIDWGKTTTTATVTFPLGFSAIPTLISNATPSPWSGSSSNASYTVVYRVAAYHKGLTSTGFTTASNGSDAYHYLAIGY